MTIKKIFEDLNQFDVYGTIQLPTGEFKKIIASALIATLEGLKKKASHIELKDVDLIYIPYDQADKLLAEIKSEMGGES